MSIHAASNLDIDRFRKVYALVSGGATEGERAAAKARATKIAGNAGLSVNEAVSKLDNAPAQPVNFFAGFDDWMEKKEPGYKTKKAREKSERNIRDDLRRSEILSAYGNEAALFACSEHEQRLNAAIAPLATWEYWIDDDGVHRRFAAKLDGRTSPFWGVEDQTPAIREAVMAAYSWPSNLDDALTEVKAWDRLRWDRGLFSGEWNHYAEVECRISLLEHALERGQPAASWADVQARFDWKRYEFERQWINPTERDDAFMERLEADMEILRAQFSHMPAQHGHRSTADKQRDVLSILGAEPNLSDREIARRAGVSPQTVGNWRRKLYL